MKPAFARMGAADRDAAFGLFLAFLQADPHYLDVARTYGDGGPEALRRALDLFVERPEIGFVWMGRRGGEVVGCCVACFAISTSRGTLVAKLDDVNVRPGLEGQGIGSARAGVAAVLLAAVLGFWAWQWQQAPSPSLAAADGQRHAGQGHHDRHDHDRDHDRD